MSRSADLTIMFHGMELKMEVEFDAVNGRAATYYEPEEYGYIEIIDAKYQNHKGVWTPLDEITDGMREALEAAVEEYLAGEGP